MNSHFCICTGFACFCFILPDCFVLFLRQLVKIPTWEYLQLQQLVFVANDKAELKNYCLHFRVVYKNNKIIF